MDEVGVMTAASAAAGAAYAAKHRKEIGVGLVGFVRLIGWLFNTFVWRFLRYYVALAIVIVAAYGLYVGPAAGYFEPKIDASNASPSAFIAENIEGLWVANDKSAYEFAGDHLAQHQAGVGTSQPVKYFGHGRYFAFQRAGSECVATVFKVIDKNTIQESYEQHNAGPRCGSSDAKRDLSGKTFTRTERGVYFASIKPGVVRQAAAARRYNGDNRALDINLQSALDTLATLEKSHR